ncbi:hypothetical protein TL16_g09361 [Triparma laevis f. inornata]|uniref:Uncharacterized protein n=1 Tax=Triparma laevis f. inornata TaxID=1714386 RepID=A0A9W7BAB8_9STRA|nr:hypothetical protein TL16_g09361 [Triparma laevis f. inornata]
MSDQFTLSRRSTVKIMSDGSHSTPSHLEGDEIIMADEEEEHEYGYEDEEEEAEMKAEEKDDDENEEEKGQKAVNYIQNMLRQNDRAGSRRRSVDWVAMPKGQEEEEEQSKLAAKEESETLWFDKVPDITECCPTLVAYLEEEMGPEETQQYKQKACRAVLKYNQHSVSQWEMNKLILFLGTLNFGDDSTDSYRRTFRSAHSTGVQLLKFNNLGKVLDWGLDNKHAIVLMAIVMGWRGEFEILGNPNQPLEDVYVPDYGALDDAERMAEETGVGKCYGQLVVLGHKEYHVNRGKLEPRGERNAAFPLMRRTKANGIRKDKTIVTASSSKGSEGNRSPIQTYCVTMRVKPKKKEAQGKVVVTSYIPDEALDMYQLGRLAVKQNDFCFRGPLTSNERGQFCGPVSRYAARIMCERTPPFSTWICAAGFDNKKDIFLSEGAPKWKEEEGENEDDWDAVTTFGLRIWQPSVGKWVEVSVNGYMHEVRETDDACGARINNSLARLEHGSIVDLSGVQFIFQDFEHMKMNRPSEETLEMFMGDFNSMRLQCPVSLETIRYSHSIAESKMDWGEGEDSSEAAGVFPACGHIVTYSTEMAQGLLNCPLCRVQSKLKQLSIAYTPAVTHGEQPPSYIFNPCGCAASLECCEFWSGITIHHPPKPGQSEVALCPYCATVLDPEKPFTRMVTGHGVKIDKDGGVMASEEEKV